MSSAVFTDNVGHTITMKRLQYTISDSINYDGTGVSKRGIKIEMQSWAKRTEVQNYLAWSNKGALNSLQRNVIGELKFYDGMDGTCANYMTASDVYIVSIEETSETWREWGQVNVVFQSEGMFTGDSVFAEFQGNGGSVDIYNVQLSIQPSTIRKNITTVPHWNGSFYQNTGYEITRIYLNGMIPWDSCSFPESIVSVFECFKTENGVEIPVEGDLSTFLKNIKEGSNSNFFIGNVFVEYANLTWYVEKKVIQVNVCFVGPHQTVVKNGGE